MRNRQHSASSEDWAIVMDLAAELLAVMADMSYVFLAAIFASH